MARYSLRIETTQGDWFFTRDNYPEICRIRRAALENRLNLGNAKIKKVNLITDTVIQGTPTNGD